MIGCIFHAFRDDGVLLLCEERRVVTRARQSLGGQVIGTGIRHARHEAPPLTIASHRIAMIETAFRTCLVACASCSTRILLTAPAPVDLASILCLAEKKDDAASCTSNFDQNGSIHARTLEPALKDVDPLGRFQAPSPALRPRATRRLRSLHLGLHLFRGTSSTTRTREMTPLSRYVPVFYGSM